MNRYLAKAAIVGALGGLLFGFDTAVISGATEQLSSVFCAVSQGARPRIAVHAYREGRIENIA